MSGRAEGYDSRGDPGQVSAPGSPRSSSRERLVSMPRGPVRARIGWLVPGGRGVRIAQAPRGMTRREGDCAQVANRYRYRRRLMRPMGTRRLIPRQPFRRSGPRSAFPGDPPACHWSCARWGTSKTRLEGQRVPEGTPAAGRRGSGASRLRSSSSPLANDLESMLPSNSTSPRSPVQPQGRVLPESLGRGFVQDPRW